MQSLIKAILYMQACFDHLTVLTCMCASWAKRSESLTGGILCRGTGVYDEKSRYIGTSGNRDKAIDPSLQDH